MRQLSMRIARGLDQTRHHTVGRDLVFGEVARQRLGEADQPSLGSNHMRAMLCADVTGNSADVDDRAGAAFA